jgi:RHS repeat-associated protein
LHSDHHGSASLATNASGGIEWQARYKPFGETRWTSGALTTNRKPALSAANGFNGMKEESALGGIYDFNARFYDPAIGRFLSVDTIVPRPSDPQSLNRFSFVRNNPLKYVDPSGHDVVLVHGFSATADPAAWKEWIMAYKGWDEARWKVELASYEKSGVSVFNKQGIHFFDYNSTSQAVNADLVKSLDNFMSGISNVTLVGHSKGANLVMAYMSAMQAGQVNSSPNRFVINKAPDPEGLVGWITGSASARAPFSKRSNKMTLETGGYGSYGSGFRSANTANIYSETDGFGNMHELVGATNIVDDVGQVFPVIGYQSNGHGRGSMQTAHSAFEALNVYVLDSHASRGLP